MHALFKRFLLVLALAAGVTVARAADAPSYLVRVWNARDGLPQNTVNALAQTPEGYLWAGTRGGLGRFDGARFVHYGLDDGLKGIGIACLAEDGTGGLWIGTVGGGLSRWRNGRITTLTTADGLVHNDVMDLAAAGPDSVWVGSKGGLQHLGPEGFTTIGVAEGLDREVVALAADGEGGVWASFEANDLFHCRPDGCVKVPGPPGREVFHGNALILDHRGDLWVGIGNGELIRRHGDVWKRYDPEDGLPTEAITCLAEGPPGEIWVGTLGGGLWVLRGDRFHPVPGTAAETRSILMSRSGSLWIGTPADGLARLTPRMVDDLPVGGTGRPGQVHGIIEEPAGTFWAGTYGGGLFHGPLGRMERLPLPPALDGHRAVMSCERMADGSLVFAGPRLLVDINPATREMTGFTPTENIQVLCTAADGTLYLGTREGLLMRRVDGALETVAAGRFPAAITALIRGPGEALWVATQGDGLHLWDAGKTEHWGTAEGLPTEILRALHPDPDDGTLWIGTLGGGLAWLLDGKIHAANQRHGLGESSVSQILEDDLGNLWLGGNRGIQRVAKRELHDLAAGRVAVVHPLVLDESDGMSSAECSGSFSPAGYRNPAGILHFSTVRGVVAVDPSDFGPAAAPPPVIIESLTVNGEALEIRTDGIEVPAGPREVEIHFTAFNYAKPEQIRFRHRLDDGGDWVESSADRSVRFSRLPPGNHRFMVSAANPDGHWNPRPARLSFTVLPHYWQTGWFRGLVMLALMSGGAALVWRWARLHVRRAAERERLAVAEADARRHLDELTYMNRVSTLGGMATTLAHELNQPLAAIHSNAEAADIFLSERVPDLAELRAILGDIREDGHRAGEVIHRMRALLQRHPFEIERLEVEQMIERTAGLLQSVLHSRKARLSLDLAPGLPAVAGDPVHLQQLLMNLILNSLEAMAETPEPMREVTLSAVRRDPGRVEFAVRDRGPGIPAAKLAKLGEPFLTTKQDGMGMGLAICHSIVSAHGGELTAENPPGGGAIVRFSLPVAAPNG